MKKEFKKNNIHGGHFTETGYPITITPNFSTLGSIIELSRQESRITFLPNGSIGDLLGFIATTLYEKYNLSHKPVDILSFDSIFLETDISQGLFFKGKRSGMIHEFTMDIDHS